MRPWENRYNQQWGNQLIIKQILLVGIFKKMSRKQYGHIHINIRVSSVNISHFSVVSWPKPKLLFSVVCQATDGKIWEMVCTWTGQLKDLNINSLNCLSYISLNFNDENLVLDWTISLLIFCFLSSPCRNTERWDYFFFISWRGRYEGCLYSNNIQIYILILEHLLVDLLHFLYPCVLLPKRVSPHRLCTHLMILESYHPVIWEFITCEKIKLRLFLKQFPTDNVSYIRRVRWWIK